MAVSGIKITVDRKAQIFVEELEIGLKKATPRALALYGGRLINRIKHEINVFAKDPSGALAKSFRLRIRRGGELGSMSVLSDSRYAAIHETGGTIKPRRANYLTIPLTPRARKFKARIFPGVLFAFKSKRGKLLLAQKTGRRKIKIHYVLKKSVRIRAKHYLSDATSKSVGDAERTFGSMAVAVTESARRTTNMKARRITL